MKWHHWLALAGVALAAYMVGVMYPGFGASVKAKVTG